MLKNLNISNKNKCYFCKLDISFILLRNILCPIRNTEIIVTKNNNNKNQTFCEVRGLRAGKEEGFLQLP